MTRSAREHYTRDFRGSAIVVLVCEDATACIDRAIAKAATESAVP